MIQEDGMKIHWPHGTLKTLRKTFEYDMFVDATDLLSDKSVIQDKDSWGLEYDRKAYRTIHGKMLRLGQTPIKSAILSYLTAEEVCVEDITRIIEDNEVPDSWKILVGVAKEREFKSRNARFYCKQVPEMRIYQTSSENNIAEGKCGLIIKAEESWHSEKLVEYSKAYHYQGVRVQVSNALKKISRVNSKANQTIPTFNGKLSGMFSAGSSAAGEDHVPYWAYYVTCVETAHHIRRHMSFLQRQPIENTTSLLLIGRVLGGLPVVIYPNSVHMPYKMFSQRAFT